MKCLDTTYFIDLIRRPPAIRDITMKLDEEGGCATTVFNVYEALFGSYAIDEVKGEKIRDKISKVVNRLEVLEFRYVDALKASEIGGMLLKNGKMVGADAITAAIAINNGCEAVVTRNKQHFEWIRDLTGLEVEAY
ncbi:MAG: type II toxin-antitoxin system VapC family toxin [Methanocellales archaeon]|nr:type II toxin-antitoxin system VapC family toxin [Methanocellales archaeon]MDI6903723.1 type II toxin-antitoxin system VapC family toxin [Methanocellales archaeon]